MVVKANQVKTLVNDAELIQQANEQLNRLEALKLQLESTNNK